ncbi:MAG TPA: hypothetical protein VIS31_10035 [Woeseiaceae bacterium]
MARRRTSESERARRLVAQEAARIIVGHGIRDYRVAKQKAADRLGVADRGSLPGNEEIEAAVAEHLAIFRGDAHEDHLRLMRVAALAAMELLAAFSPRLVGPVLAGTADENSAINLHVFADSPEMVAMGLSDLGVSYKPYERRLKTRRDQVVGYAGFEFHQNGRAVQATVFPIDGIRQAPISPIDGRPMKRIGIDGVQRLLEHI